jgi:dienelactone hydrolase
MHIVIIADIFGRTPELESIVTQLASHSHGSTVIDPYEGEYLGFKNESKAYSYFRKRVGIESYINTALEATAGIGRDVLYIGFSVGASVLWVLSDRMSAHVDARAVCFYGSQIRYYVDLNPKIATEIIFPRHEPHFDVADLLARISAKPNVTCYRTEHLHGFMNQRSINYSQAAYLDFMSFLMKRARRVL